jgi:predicted nucleic acid-binding Zn ribbon protein
MIPNVIPANTSDDVVTPVMPGSANPSDDVVCSVGCQGIRVMDFEKIRAK